MNKAAAKREACFRAALFIESALAAGWDGAGSYGDPADVERVVCALEELAGELHRRGGR